MNSASTDPDCAFIIFLLLERIPHSIGFHALIPAFRPCGRDGFLPFGFIALRLERSRTGRDDFALAYGMHEWNNCDSDSPPSHKIVSKAVAAHEPRAVGRVAKDRV